MAEDQLQPGQAQRHLVVKTEETWGPIPDPEILAAYDELCPGAAARIMGWAEEEGLHRRSCEREAITHATELGKIEQRQQGRGQLLAYSLALITLGLAFALAFLGAHTQAAGLAGGAIAVLAGAFVWDRQRARPKE